MKHHTKDKGDLAVVLVMADLVKQGLQVCLPVSEHLPFDLIAVDDTVRTHKVQVKHCKVRDGSIHLNLRHSYPSKKGYQVKRDDPRLSDVYAAYCPDNEKIYYVRASEIVESGNVNVFSLRIEKSNKSDDRIRYAEDYELW